MAQIVKIASLDINVEALTAKMAASKNSIEALKKEIKNLSEEKKTGENAAASYTAQLEKLNTGGYSNTRSADFYHNKINENADAIQQKAVRLSELDTALQHHQQQMQIQSVYAQAYAENQLKSVQSLKAEESSVNDLNSALQHNTALFRSLSEEQQLTATTGGKLLDVIALQETGYKSLTGTASGYTEQLANESTAFAEKELADYSKIQRGKVEEAGSANAEIILSEKEKLDRISQLQQEYHQQKKEKEDEQKALAVSELENNRIEETARLEYDLEIQLQELEAKKAQKIAYSEQTQEALQLIEEKYAAEKQLAQEAAAENKMQLAADAFGNISAILGKESAAGRAAAIAQATIDTHKGAVSAYSAMAGIPVVGPALGAAAAAAVIAAGIANVKKITATKTKFKRGGLVQGPLHALGGVPFSVAGSPGYEMEGGEFVVNRDSARLFLPQLEAINRYGLINGNYVFPQQMPPGFTPKINSEEIKKAVAEGAKEGAMLGSRLGSMQGVSSGISEREANAAVAYNANF